MTKRALVIETVVKDWRWSSSRMRPHQVVEGRRDFPEHLTNNVIIYVRAREAKDSIENSLNLEWMLVDLPKRVRRG